MKSLKPFIFLVLLLAMIPLTGCEPSSGQIASQTATAQTTVASLWTPTSTTTSTPPPTATETSIPTITAAPTSTITPTPKLSSLESASFQIKDLTFSMDIPIGWQKSIDPDHIILSGPTTAGITTIVTFSLDEYSMGGIPLQGDEMGIAMFSAHVQDTIAGMVQNVVSERENFLTTPGGEPYFRWVMHHKTNGKEIHQIFYIFGSGKWFLTIMYGRAKSAEADTDALMDAAVKTLKFEQ